MRLLKIKEIIKKIIKKKLKPLQKFMIIWWTISYLRKQISAIRGYIPREDVIAEADKDLVKVIREQNNQEKAVEKYKKAIVFRSDSLELYSHLANLLVKQGKLDEAITYLEKGLCLRKFDNRMNSREEVTDKGFHLATLVWGNYFTDIFLNMALPSLLAPGNIPVFQDRKNSVYKIYTTAKDAEVIIKSKSYQLLAGIINTQIHTFEFPNYSLEQYKFLTICQKPALIECYKQDCAFVYLTPDHLYADGSFTNLLKIAARGKRFVMQPHMEVIAETFIPAIKKQFFSNPDRTIVSVPPRDLVKTALANLHPSEKSRFWKAKGFNRWPAYIYWQKDSEGLLKRCFHMHPLMIHPAKKNVLPIGTIDGSNYLDLVCPKVEDFYIVQDSDEIMSVGITPLAHSTNNLIRQDAESSVAEVVDWAKRETSNCHRYFVQHKLKIHAEELLEERWKEVEAESDAAIDKINYMIDCQKGN